MQNIRKILCASALALALTATAVACSDDESGGANRASSSAASSSAGAAAHNAADVMFNQMMIPHHRQAVEMSGLVATRSTDERVRGLATRISGAQQPEIDQMTATLRSWGQPVMMPDGGHGGHGMGGMMTDDQMRELRGLSGSAFDNTWLRMMIEHHQGAVDMAGDEIRDGQHAQTKALARTIIDAQQREIAEMKAMLGQ